MNWLSVCLGIALALLSAGSAGAQNYLSLGEMRDCICLAGSVDQLKDEMEIRRGLYEERQARIDALGREQQEGYFTVDQNDPAALAAYKAKLVRLRRLRDGQQRDITPDYNDAVTRYNGAVARYTQLCASRQYVEEIMQRAQQGLQCTGF